MLARPMALAAGLAQWHSAHPCEDEIWRAIIEVYDAAPGEPFCDNRSGDLRWLHECFWSRGIYRVQKTSHRRPHDRLWQGCMTGPTEAMCLAGLPLKTASRLVAQLLHRLFVDPGLVAADYAATLSAETVRAAVYRRRRERAALLRPGGQVEIRDGGLYVKASARLPF